MMRKYSVEVRYPMPMRKKLDDDLSACSGWWASGTDHEMRDHAIDTDEDGLLEIIRLCPPDGFVNISVKGEA